MDRTAGRRETRILFWALLMGLAAVLNAQEVGRISYIEGDVQLLRDDTVLERFDLDIGDTLRSMDLIQTGFDGYVEVELLQPAGSTVRVRENSAYYVEESTEDGARELRVRVLGGRLEMVVTELSSREMLNVETQTGVLGVRGTSFDVLTAPDETTLFGIREGTVVVTAAGGRINAGAGSAIETAGSGPPQGESVPDGDFDRLYTRWTEIRLQTFRSGAPTFVRSYARRYLDTRGTFEEAYEALIAYRPALEEALGDSNGAGGVGGSLGSEIRLRTEITPALIRMRSILPLFETTVYRLRELERFHNQGIGVTRIGDQRSQDFFRLFARDQRRTLQQLSEVRSVFRMYREFTSRGRGDSPGVFGETPLDSSGSLLDSMQF